MAMRTDLLIALVGAVLVLSACGGGGGGSSGPAPYATLDLTTGTVSESRSLPDVTAASATSTHMVFRRVPAGSFTMGQAAGTLGVQADETPAAGTAVSEFWIAVFEVTQGQW